MFGLLRSELPCQESIFLNLSFKDVLVFAFDSPLFLGGPYKDFNVIVVLSSNPSFAFCFCSPCQSFSELLFMFLSLLFSCLMFFFGWGEGFQIIILVFNLHLLFGVGFVLNCSSDHLIFCSYYLSHILTSVVGHIFHFVLFRFLQSHMSNLRLANSYLTVELMSALADCHRIRFHSHRYTMIVGLEYCVLYC